MSLNRLPLFVLLSLLALLATAGCSSPGEVLHDFEGDGSIGDDDSAGDGAPTACTSHSQCDFPLADQCIDGFCATDCTFTNSCDGGFECCYVDWVDAGSVSMCVPSGVCPANGLLCVGGAQMHTCSPL